MARAPGSRSMTDRSVKLSPTRPMWRSEWKATPSKETMPPASWPRCWRAWRPSAVRAPASGWPNTPKTPHSSCSLSSSKGNVFRSSMPRLSDMLASVARPTVLNELVEILAVVVAVARIRRGRGRGRGVVGRRAGVGIAAGIVAIAAVYVLHDLRLDVLGQGGHQALAQLRQYGLGFGVGDPVRRFLHEPGEEKQGNDQQKQAAHGSEDEAEPAIDRSDAAIDDEVRDAGGDVAGNDESDEENHRGGDDRRDGAAFDVCLHRRNQRLVQEIRRGHRRHPGNYRKNLAGESTNHGERGRDDHHDYNNEVENGQRHAPRRSRRPNPPYLKR